jgi:hypothetical protein
MLDFLRSPRLVALLVLAIAACDNDSGGSTLEG